MMFCCGAQRINPNGFWPPDLSFGSTSRSNFHSSWEIFQRLYGIQFWTDPKDESYVPLAVYIISGQNFIVSSTLVYS